MKKITALFLILTLVLTLTACSDNSLASDDMAFAAQSTGGGVAETSKTVDNLVIAHTPIEVEYDRDDLDSASEDTQATIVRLDGDSISVDGGGATVDGTIVTITAAGTYSLSGTLDDGQIIVNTEDQEKVKLVLNGVNIANSTSAPIYVRNAEKTVITLADGTENFITDGTAYLFEDEETDEPNAAIFSHDDLTLNGDGALIVEANFNHGIASKDDLKITGGVITVNAVNDGLKGKDSLTVKDGVITVNAGGDGLQSQNGSEAEKGYVAIEGGTLNISSGLDGIQAETGVLVSGGEVRITTGNGSSDSSFVMGWGFESRDNNDAASAKGLKAGVDATITGGVITIDSADDAIHSNGSFTLVDGVLWLASGDDGIHADATLEINGGKLTIFRAYEGLESAVITLNDGIIHLTASDDGINVAGGNDDSSINGRPGQNEFAPSDEYHLFINGGYAVIDAGGDGLDSNGYFDMTGGLIIVNGPTNNGNGPLDYNGTFNISGGTLVAVGSSGMAQAPSTSSTQYSVMYNFESMQASGTVVHIETANGEEVLTFLPAKEYQSVLLSSAALENGETYVVYTGGSSTGAETDGLYAAGVYTTGTEVASLTISSVVTQGGVQRGGPGGGRPGGGFPPGGRP